MVYLGVMCYIGRQQFYDGHYLFYFGIIAATLLVIFCCASHSLNGKETAIKTGNLCRLSYSRIGNPGFPAGPSHNKSHHRTQYIEKQKGK